MSAINVTEIKRRVGGAPTFPQGINVTTSGVSTFSGPVTVGGTLTYDDVTNIDSVGIITAQAGVKITGGQLLVGAAASVYNDGAASFSGIVTATTVHATTIGDSNSTVYGDGSNLTGVSSWDTYDCWLYGNS